jgi:hypothetical protein
MSNGRHHRRQRDKRLSLRVNIPRALQMLADPSQDPTEQRVLAAIVMDMLRRDGVPIEGNADDFIEMVRRLTDEGLIVDGIVDIGRLMS